LAAAYNLEDADCLLGEWVAQEEARREADKPPDAD